MSSPVSNDFVVVPRELPGYLTCDQVGSVVEEVAVRNLQLLATFSMEKQPRGPLLVNKKIRELELASTSLWGCSWPIEQKKEMLKVVAASFYSLRKAVAGRSNFNFNATITREEEALKGLHELASEIDKYWKDQESAQEAWALAEKLQPLSRESSSSSIAQLNASETGRNSPVEESAEHPQRAMVEGSPSRSPLVEVWWGCLPYFRSCPSCFCPPCFYPSWCAKWLKPVAAMD